MAKFLTSDEYQKLIMDYRNGNNEAYNTILGTSLYLISDVINKKVHSDAYDFELLYQIGLLGLKDAIETVDNNSIFKQFAEICIYYKIINHLTKSPYPTFDTNSKRFIISLARRFKLPINDDIIAELRAYLELLPPKVRVCIKYKYGFFNNKEYSNASIASMLKFDESVVDKAMKKFEEDICARYGVEYIQMEKPKKLIEYFSNVSMEELKKAIFILPNKYRTLIERCFGESLEDIRPMSELDKMIFQNNIIVQININILNERKKKVKESKRNMLFESLKGFSKDEINEALYLISNEDLAVILKKYGKDLSEDNTLDENDDILLKNAINNLIIELKILTGDSKKITDYIKGHDLEEIREIVDGLLSEDKELIYLRFGEDLNEDNKLDSKLNKQVYQVLRKIKKLLIYGVKVRTIFTFFPSNSHEEVIKAIENLPLKYRNVIYLRYGRALDEFNDVTNDEKSMFYGTILNLLKKNLVQNSDIKKKNKRLRNKTIFDCFSDYSEEEIILAVKKLPLKYQEIIYKRYGKNLDEFHKLDSTATLYNQIFPAIRKILEGKVEDLSKVGQKTGRKRKTLLEYTEGYSLEDVRLAVSKLEVTYQDRIFARFGEELTESKSVENRDSVYFKNMILPKLLEQLKKSKKKSLYDVLSLSKEETLKRVALLSDKEKEDLYKRFGYDLDNPVEMSLPLDFINYVDMVIIPKLKIVKENDELDLLSDFIENIYDRIKVLSCDEIKIATLRLGMSSSNYNIEDLVSYFGKNAEEINKITLRFLGIFENKEDEIASLITSLFSSKKDNKKSNIKD